MGIHFNKSSVLFLIFNICVCMRAHTRAREGMHMSVYVGFRTMWKLTPTSWVIGIEIRISSLVAGVFTC